MTKVKQSENESGKCTCVCEECGNKSEKACQDCRCQDGKCEACKCDKCGGKCSCQCDCQCGDNCDCGENCNCESGACECSEEGCECGDVAAEFEQLEGELTQEKQARMQLLADFVNYRKRVETDMGEMKISANKAMLQQIIDVVDDFDRAIQLEGDKVDHDNDFYQGVLIIRRKFTELLTNYGLEEVKVEVGGAFDPAMMEALTTAPVADKKQVNKIVHVAGKGYMNKDTKKVFRTAKVIIGK